MAEERWTVHQNTFISESIAARPKQGYYWRCRPTSTHLAGFRAHGPSALLELPARLRLLIIKEALEKCEFFGNVLCIFLTCKQFYFDAASIFYRHIWADITNRWCEVPLFLRQPLHKQTPRLHVRTMVLRLYPKVNLDIFNTFYLYAMQRMARYGSLRRVEIELRGMRSQFNDHNGRFSKYNLPENEVTLLLGPKRDIRQVGPAFVAGWQFQRFLDFLEEPLIPEVSLYVVDNDHYEFWCPFHRKSTRPSCGKPHLDPMWRLEINIPPLLKHLLFARVAPDADERTTGVDDKATIEVKDEGTIEVDNEATEDEGQ